MFNILNNKGALKKHLSLFLILGVIISIGIIAYSMALPSDQYIINGNSVEWENSAGKIVVTPHTITSLSDGCFEIEATSYFTSQDLDCIISSKNGKFSAKNSFVWANISHDVLEYYPVTETKFNTCLSDNFSYSLNPKHAICYDSVYANITFEHDFETIDTDKKTITWQETVQNTRTVQQYFYDWQSNPNFNKISSDKDYFVLSNVYFSQGETKKTKLCLNANIEQLPNGRYGTNEKVDILCKRSSETLQDAISSNNIMIVDPWWNASFSYKQSDSVNHSSSGTLNNFTYISNGATGFRLFGDNTNQIVWVKSNINATNYLYYNSYSDYAYSNSSENAGLCFDVEYGNLTHKDTCTYEGDYLEVYHFGEGSGTQVGDSTVSPNNLTTTGNPVFSFTTKKFGYSLNFDGINDGANAASAITALGDATQTISFWLYVPDWVANVGDRIFYIYTASGGDTMYQLYPTGNAGNKTLTFLAYQGGNPIINNIISDFKEGEWIFYAITANETKTDIYINGMLNKSLSNSNFTLGSFAPTTNSFGYDGSAQFFNGYIDEIRVSNAAKSPEWILREYNHNLSFFSSAVSETEARIQIASSITNSLPLAKIYTDQQIYVRYLNGTQKLGTFDKVAVYKNQRWAFNFVDVPDESYTNMDSLSPSLFVWENDSITEAQIDTQITDLISSTLAS